MKLLVILFLIRLYARITEEKYGCTGIKVAKSIEIYCTKLSKIKCGIDFLLTCKRNNLTPTFPRTKLAVKVSFQLRNKISPQIIEAELNNKHQKKKILLNKIKKRQDELKSRVGYVTYVVFYHNANKVISKKRTDCMKTHHKKIEGLKRTPKKQKNKQTILEIVPQKTLSTTFHHMLYQKKKSMLCHLALMRTFRLN